MAVAEDAVNPSPPPPARIVVVVLALVRVAVRALVYLAFATSWVLSVIGASTVVAHLAWGEGSAPYVFLLALTEAAVKVVCKFFLVALAAVVLCDRLRVQFVSGSCSEFEKSPFEAAMEESVQGLFMYFHVVVLGLVAYLAFFPLICAGILVMMMSAPGVEGSISQGEMVGSAIVDVGLLAIQAISCLIIFPAVALSVWKKYQADRKERRTIAVLLRQKLRSEGACEIDKELYYRLC